MITSFDYDEGFEIACEHCGATGYDAMFYTCCAEAEAKWRRVAYNYIPPQPVLIVHPSRRHLLPDWLSLRGEE